MHLGGACHGCVSPKPPWTQKCWRGADNHGLRGAGVRVEVFVQPRAVLGLAAVFQGLDVVVQPEESKLKALGTRCDVLHCFFLFFSSSLLTSQALVS